MSRRRALVTGASSGIGAAIAARLAADGAAVVGVSRSGNAPDGVRPLACDLSQPQQLDGVVERTVAELGGLDLVVNNAAAALWRPALDIDRGFFDQLVDLNLWAPLQISRLAHPHLAESEDPLVVFIGSVDASRPSAGAAVYGATKAGLGALTVALAKEWHADGIRVAQIDPGLIDTPVAAEAVASAGTRVNIAGRAGKPTEIAGLVAYLASADGRFVTGTRLTVDGGALALGPYDVLR